MKKTAGRLFAFLLLLLELEEEPWWWWLPLLPPPLDGTAMALEPPPPLAPDEAEGSDDGAVVEETEEEAVEEGDGWWWWCWWSPRPELDGRRADACALSADAMGREVSEDVAEAADVLPVGEPPLVEASDDDAVAVTLVEEVLPPPPLLLLWWLLLSWCNRRPGPESIALLSGLVYPPGGTSTLKENTHVTDCHSDRGLVKHLTSSCCCRVASLGAWAT